MTLTSKQKRSILELGQESDFWKIICELLDGAIEAIEEEKNEFVENNMRLASEQFKVELVSLKEKKKALEYLKELPASALEFLSERRASEESFDPYPKSSGEN